MHKTALLVTLWCAFINADTFAQTSAIPNLSQLHVGIGYMPVLNFKPTTFDYIPTSLKRVTLGVNYGNGYIKYHFQHALIKPNKPLYPDCNLFDNSLGYTHFIKVLKRGVYVFAGLQLGLNTYHMDVSGTNLSGNRSLETELSSGIEVGLEIRVKNKLGLNTAFKQQRIFASPRNDLYLIDLGLIYYLNSNAKLKTWLD